MKTDTKKKQEVYTLLVEVGRIKGDGLPNKSTGAALMCYSSGCDEDEAVREATALLKKAGLAPLSISGYGTAGERALEGHDISEDEQNLMKQALDENSVIVSQTTAFYD
ncbi:MAG: hypothetical protein O3A15_00860 [Proteobacteria bacterium]|jgi:hypothetical protein|nr:hypothetical protein [Pseudomonadota bacterium]